MKTLILLRGLPGAGKTTLAHTLFNAVPIAADDWMVDATGAYSFDPARLEECHELCQAMTASVLRQGQSVVVHNTSTRAHDVEPYRRIAADFGASFVVLTVENWHGGVSDHSVPAHTLDRMAVQLADSIKLR